MQDRSSSGLHVGRRGKGEDFHREKCPLLTQGNSPTPVSAGRLGHYQGTAEHLKGPLFTEREHTLQNTDVLSKYTREFIWIIQVLEKPWQWANPLAGETTPGSVPRVQPLHKGPQQLIIVLCDRLVNLALDATFRASITAYVISAQGNLETCRQALRDKKRPAHA